MMPPITKLTMKPSANIIGVDEVWIWPLKSVADPGEDLDPVGTAISIVANIIGMRSEATCSGDEHVMRPYGIAEHSDRAEQASAIAGSRTGLRGHGPRLPR